MTQDTDFDIVIAGGGMVGVSLAYALAPLQMRIAIIEQVPPDAGLQPSFDDRSIALSLGSQRIFAGMGLWPALAPAATAIKTIHVSDRGHFGVTRLHHDEHGVEALGYVMIGRDVGRVLQHQVGTLAHTVLMCPARVEAVAAHDDHVRITVNQDGGATTVSAKLLVAADGAMSKVRALLAIPARQWDYHQDAVIANVTTSQRHHNVAYERFTDSGPLAVLPLSQGRSAVVWTVQRGAVATIMSLSDQDFLQQLQARFGRRLGAFTRVGKRASYPLRLVRVPDPVRHRVLVVGNAAHSLHPIAGQGFNLGLRDAAILAEIMADARRQGLDPGVPQVLQAFVRRQSGDQRQTTAITDTLVRMFSNSFPPLVCARTLGMLALEFAPALRRQLATHAMGMSGAVSRLGRGVAL